MVVRKGEVARREDIKTVILAYEPFSKIEGFKIEDIKIVVPSANPDPKEYINRIHRAYIRYIPTGKILVSAKSAHAMFEKIEGGWKYDPNRKEGLHK